MGSLFPGGGYPGQYYPLVTAGGVVAEPRQLSYYAQDDTTFALLGRDDTSQTFSADASTTSQSLLASEG